MFAGTTVTDLRNRLMTLDFIPLDLWLLLLILSSAVTALLAILCLWASGTTYACMLNSQDWYTVCDRLTVCQS